MKTISLSVIDAIEAKFLRSKIQTHSTKLGKDMNEFDKSWIIGHANLFINESIILCFFPSKDYFWVLTNKQLIISDLGKINYIPLVEICEVGLTKIFSGAETKLENTSIDIIAKKNKKRSIELRVEKRTWPIVYEILSFVVVHLAQDK
jgi:hypothetical protein